MPKTAFESLPSDARIWIFPTHQGISPHEEERLLSVVDRFLESWAAHGTPLTAARDWRHGRFLLVGVDESSAPPSGCSIDAMVNVLKSYRDETGVDLLDHGPVWYRDGDEIRKATRAEFKALAQQGEVTLDTLVFDNTITRKEQVVEGGWEKPAGASWHRRAFF